MAGRPVTTQESKSSQARLPRELSPPVEKREWKRVAVLLRKDATTLDLAEVVFQDIEDGSELEALSHHANMAWRDERVYFEEELLFCPSKWVQLSPEVLRMDAWSVQDQSEVTILLQCDKTTKSAK